MSQVNFKVSLTARNALELIKREHTASLVYDEYIDIGEGKGIGTLVFEKYYIRNSNRAALTVICDDIRGKTEVRSIATGASQHMFFKLDWGASSEFAHSVEKILRDYI